MLAQRVDAFPPEVTDRLTDRIDEALTDSHPRRALRVMTELQLDTVLLARAAPTSTVHGPGLPRGRTCCASTLDNADYVNQKGERPSATAAVATARLARGGARRTVTLHARHERSRSCT